jgi:HK97 family phage major capsid protein
MPQDTALMDATQELIKSTKDLQGIVTDRLKSNDEKLASALKAVEDLQKNMASANKRAIFPEFDPRMLKFNGTQESFTKLMVSRCAPDSGPSKVLVEELQRKNDELIVKSAIARALRDQGIPAPKMQEMKAWQEFSMLTSELQKALDTETTGEGLQWVPTGFSQQLMELIILEMRVANLFQTFTAPADPYTWPFQAARGTAQTVAESITTPATALADSMRLFTGKTPTANVTFTAKKLRALEVFTREWNEDTINPALPWLFRTLAQAIADGWEDAIQNADSDGTHFDSDVTAGSPKTLCGGLRKYCIDTNPTYTADLSVFDDSGLRRMRQGMGVYGVRLSSLVYITSIQGSFRFLQLPNVQTLDKYGPNAAVLAGEIARHDSIPIVVSEFARADLDAAGKYVAGGVLTNCLLVHRDRWMRGVRPGIGVETDRIIHADQTVIVAFDRGDFQQVDSATAKSVMMGVGVASI